MNPKLKLLSRMRSFETLELRRMLAGNVTVSDPTTTGGTLEIIGDASANVLVLTQVGTNSFKLTGGGTKINGSNSPQTFNNVTNGILIDMGAGNDVLTLKNLNIPGEVEGTDISLGIMLGDGTDVLVMTGITTQGAAAINGGSGTNAITINSSTFNYDLGIQTYSGTDAVAIVSTNIFGALSIQLGDGTNALSMVKDNVTSVEESGKPSGGLPDEFDILECAFFDIECGAEILGGSGVDAIAMNTVHIDCLTEINTCGGNDAVAIVNSRFGNAPVDGWSCDNWDTSGLCVETGLGNDAVSLVNTNVYGFLQVDTSGDVCCPTCEESASPSVETSGTNDGNDAVSLVNVQVLQSELGVLCNECCEDGSQTPDSITPFEEGGGDCCFCVECSVEQGVLLIYTGNGADAVTVTKVTTDGEAAIYTTDFSSLDKADAVTVVNSSFNRNDEEIPECADLPLIESAGLEIETGIGNDAITISNDKVVGECSVDSGDGTDAVVINALVADEIFAEVGPGNHDALTVTNSTATEANFFDDGGSGGVLVRAHNHFISFSPPTNTAGNGFATVVG